jgi:hypothetical protein
MRDKILYLVISVLLASSCSREKPVPVIIHPLQIDLNADVSQLSEQLKKRNTTLVYENSYEGEQKGVKLFYFDDESENLHYHFEVYTLSDKIKGIEGGISSKQLTKDELYSKVERDILPDFKSSSDKLTNALVKAERGEAQDTSGYYGFEIKTKELQEKLK